MRIFQIGFRVRNGPRSRRRVGDQRSRDDRGSRDDVVAAQFDSPDAAAAYADLHEGSGGAARFFRSRIRLVSRNLAAFPGGDLLDVGCGPGMMVRALLESRPGDFRITVLDRSPAMVEACALSAGGPGNVRARVGRVEEMPFPDASFDVVLAMGVLEYTDISEALAEISRVARKDGLVLVTMLNPVSLYRLFQWYLYWPLLRGWKAMKAVFHASSEEGTGAAATGIMAYRERTLRAAMSAAGLRPVDVAYFDVTFIAPRIDRVVQRCFPGWQKRSEDTFGRGWRKWMGSAYMIVSCREEAAQKGQKKSA